MNTETQFIEGMRVYAPNANAPDYIICNGELERDGVKTRFVIKRGKSGKYYAAVDTFKPNTQPNTQPNKAPVKDRPQPDHGGFEDDSIPF